MTIDLTARAGLTKDSDDENYSVPRVNANTDKIDSLLGLTVCTSGTRPATNLFDGRMIFETDTDKLLIRVSGAWEEYAGSYPIVANATARDALPGITEGKMCYRLDANCFEYYNNSGWRPFMTVPVNDATERNGLTNRLSGQSVYRYDKNWSETWDGSAWRVERGAFVVTSALADITNPVTGQEALLTTDNMVYRWTGSAWLGVRHTAAGGGQARYQKTGSQSIPNTTNTKVAFATTEYSTADVSVAGNNTFTLNRTGLWRLTTGLRFAAGAGAGELFAFWGKGNDATVIYVHDSRFTTSPNGIQLSTERRFTAADTVSVWVWLSGGARNVYDTDAGGSVHAALTWVAP